MKSLSKYITEKEQEKKEEENNIQDNIKFTIWEEPKKKIKWLENNEKYQKIEYKYIDDKKNIEICFLLGFKDNSWQLWIGKIGAISYDDDPWCSFETKSFAQAVTDSLQKIEDFIKDVEENKNNWVQFYTNI